ncbi:hypothetical protein BVRB_7g175190 isoform B [Beta vulgaris subsp. vulgaris]|uniref:protein DOUBLE-STRAND BREAK FORMATION isoform X2 n=1 Tax=Beta vulgaris subsp. vulgaris TaxID=3555 RepID=UPI00053FEAFC|nr:protein DOUBLE-STRAND BREAK FORMATION isoform X2 [Beta vulgaris subsp. vulgaris]KMT05388.1 hypothetical protein BVRB_7g175190 isoform B [Beta vulgaris subsp. vulgaris]
MADVSLSAHQLSLFYSQIQLRRFDDSTLRILELILSSKDVKLLLELRSKLKEFLRSQSLIAIREAAEKPIEHKLLILEFLVRAFAIVDDIESCLAVRYEGLIMRDTWTVNHLELRVSCSEWMNFAEDAFNNEYYSVTAKACENALLCLKEEEGDYNCDNLWGNTWTISKIQRLEDIAIRLSTCHSDFRTLFCIDGQYNLLSLETVDMKFGTVVDPLAFCNPCCGFDTLYTHI